MAAKNPLIFDVLGNILVDKSEEVMNFHVQDTENFKTVSRFMVLKYLTMSPDYRVRDLVLENYLSLEGMEMRDLYKLLLRNIPQQRSKFIRYIK